MAQTSNLPKISLDQDSIFAEAEFSRGIVRDVPRSSIPVGGMYDCVDFMVDRPGVLWKRGGTEQMTGIAGTNQNGINFVCAPEFPSGMRVFALSGDGVVYNFSDVGSDGQATAVGPLGIWTKDNPHLYVNRVFVPANDGITPPKKIWVPGVGGNPPTDVDPLVIENMGGNPPAGRFITVHLSRVCLANTFAYPQRVYFSPPRPPDIFDVEGAWDKTNAYIDTNHTITGIVPCQGVLLVFSDGHTERIVGDVIPGQVGANMSLQPVGEVGCADARSIAPWRGNVVFAGQGGIWVSNGVGFDSLIEKDDGSGIASYWREIFDDAKTNGSGYEIIAGGIVNRDYYMISLSYNETVVDTLLCYLPRKAWTRLSNIGVSSFASSFVGANELFGGTIQFHPGNRLIRVSSIFKPTAMNSADHDGVNVAPDVQFRMIGEGIGVKAYGHGHLTYDLNASQVVGGSPYLTLTAAYGIEANTGWLAVQEGSPMNPTPQQVSGHGTVRKRFMLNRDAQTMNLRIQQTNGSAQTEIYAVEQEVRAFNATADSGIYGAGA